MRNQQVGMREKTAPVSRFFKTSSTVSFSGDAAPTSRSSPKMLKKHFENLIEVSKKVTREELLNTEQ